MTETYEQPNQRPGSSPSTTTTAHRHRRAGLTCRWPTRPDHRTCAWATTRSSKEWKKVGGHPARRLLEDLPAPRLQGRGRYPATLWKSTTASWILVGTLEANQLITTAPGPSSSSGPPRDEVGPLHDHLVDFEPSLPKRVTLKVQRLALPPQLPSPAPPATGTGHQHRRPPRSPEGQPVRAIRREPLLAGQGGLGDAGAAGGAARSGRRGERPDGNCGAGRSR